MGVLVAPCATPFLATAAAISPALAARMTGRSWRDVPAAPPLAALAHLTVRHRTLTGGVADGELVVAAAAAAATVTLFGRLYAIGFPLRQLALVDAYDGDDARSMEADNSSALNVRTIAGTSILSDHARGIAIDLNPVENPMVWRAPPRWVPAAGAAFLDRRVLRPGMIVRPGPVTAIFDELGWEWGGDWPQVADLHHVVWRGRAAAR
ncbi:MAG: M15 family metallopeptidase [Kofleriaceae bacterium]